MASRYEKEDSKRRILSACVQLFIEKGYQKTTTVEILKKADDSIAQHRHDLKQSSLFAFCPHSFARTIY